MMLDFILQNADRPTVFRKKLTDLVTGNAEKSGLFGELIEDDPTTIAARALAVQHRRGASFGAHEYAGSASELAYPGTSRPTGTGPGADKPVTPYEIIKTASDIRRGLRACVEGTDR